MEAVISLCSLFYQYRKNRKSLVDGWFGAYSQPKAPKLNMVPFSISAMAVRLGTDIWIAGPSAILDDVFIGGGSVMAAGSVISRDIAPLVVAAGIPVKESRSR